MREKPSEIKKLHRTFSEEVTILKRVTPTLFSVRNGNRRKPCLVDADKIRLIPT